MGYFNIVKSLTSSLFLLLQKMLEEVVFFHFERNVLPNLKYIFFYIRYTTELHKIIADFCAD